MQQPGALRTRTGGSAEDMKAFYVFSPAYRERNEGNGIVGEGRQAWHRAGRRGNSRIRHSARDVPMRQPEGSLKTAAIGELRRFNFTSGLQYHISPCISALTRRSWLRVIGGVHRHVSRLLGATSRVPAGHEGREIRRQRSGKKRPYYLSDALNPVSRARLYSFAPIFAGLIDFEKSHWGILILWSMMLEVRISLELQQNLYDTLAPLSPDLIPEQI
jgi:hypothetical protein